MHDPRALKKIWFSASFWTVVSFIIQEFAYAHIHRAPIIIRAGEIRLAQYHNISSYRLFKASEDGEAIAIPFQIDEKDQYGDFILDQGPKPNKLASNRIFDYIDELSFMGSDVGPLKEITHWPMKKPTILYALKFLHPSGSKYEEKGAVYLGIYFTSPPPLAKKSYVDYDLNAGKITTSNYTYIYDKKNYLIIDEIFINPHEKETKSRNSQEDALKKADKTDLDSTKSDKQGKSDISQVPPEDLKDDPQGPRNTKNHFVQEKQQPYHLMDSSSLFMNLDLKYFLTFAINEKSFESEIEAYKTGPIRTIARVIFNYKLLKLNFELGMYTEISFFSNSIVLPAVIDNPINSKKILNKGSEFYYGFSLVKNPSSYNIQTNLPAYREQSFFDFLKPKEKQFDHYWFTSSSRDFLVFVDLQLSAQMKASGSIPRFYQENKSSSQLQTRKDDALPLGKSRVNFAVSIDLTSLEQGLHNIYLNLFIENSNSEKIQKEFKDLPLWRKTISRLPSS